MDASFLGGALNRPAEDALAGDGWRAAGPDGDLFLRADAPGCRLFTWDSLAILVRGYARPANRSGPPDAEGVAESLRCHYLEHGDLAVNGLEGSFTVVLLDGQARRVLLYRNLVGAGFTYYHAGPSGLLFGGNLADLVAASGRRDGPTAPCCRCSSFTASRPAATRCSRASTACFRANSSAGTSAASRRTQRQTFADLVEATPADGDPVERLHDTMAPS